MAYCKKCGAYIPDGQSGCLACGYDEAAERKAAEEKRKREEKRSTGFAAQEYEAEKAEMERRRRAQNMENEARARRMRDAEAQQRANERRREYERRRSAQQAQDRKWAEEEYQRRQSEYERQREYSSTSRNAYNQPMRHKAMAVMSYISIFFILPFLFCRDDAYAVYHAKQGVALAVFGVIADALTAILSPVGGILSLMRVYIMIKGIMNAAQDRMEPLPIIGKYVDR